MAYNVPVLNTAKEAWQPYALDVLAAILGGSDSSRFSQELMRGQQVAAGAGASYDATSRLSNLFLISAVPAQNHTVAQLQAAINGQITKLQTQLVSPAELARVKTQVIAGKIYSQDSITSQATTLGSLVSVGLPWQLADSYVDKIQAVTAEQVLQVAKQYLVHRRLTQGVLHLLPINASDAQQMPPVITAPQGGIH